MFLPASPASLSSSSIMNKALSGNVECPETVLREEYSLRKLSLGDGDRRQGGTSITRLACLGVPLHVEFVPFHF